MDRWTRFAPSSLAPIHSALPPEVASFRGSFADALASCHPNYLQAAFAHLSPTDRQDLRRVWGSQLNEIESLAREGDPHIFYEGLLQIAQGLEDSDRLEPAGLVYSALLGNARDSIPVPIRDRAQARWNAMTGLGDWQARAGFLARRISREATRPDMLIAMGAAGATFRMARLAGTVRFSGALQSAWALRAASTSAAFLAETVAFTAVGKLAGAAFGREQSWEGGAIFNEWASGATMLLGLKAFGGFANLAARRWLPDGSFARVVLPQAGMFGGILLGHRLSEWTGLHPEREGDTWLVDGLSTLLTLNVAGRLQHAVMGPSFAAFERRMDLHTDRIARRAPAMSERLRQLWEPILPSSLPSAVTAEGIRMAGLPATEFKASDSISLMTMGDGPPGPVGRRGERTPPEEGGARASAPIPLAEEGVGDLEALAARNAEPGDPRNLRYQLPDTPYFRDLISRGAIDLEKLAMYAEAERWNADVGSVIQNTLRAPLIGRYMYSPGGAAIVERGREQPGLLPQLTGRWRRALVAMPSRAILGLGQAAEDGDFTIRAEQGLPIAGGKSIYFFTTAGVDADYQTWRTHLTPRQIERLRAINVDDLLSTGNLLKRSQRKLAALSRDQLEAYVTRRRNALAQPWRSAAFAEYLRGVANNYGFINIEDEAGEFLPHIFGMLESLKGQCCVWSDDVMGTGVITAAGMLSWAHLTGRMAPNQSLANIRGVIFGAGAGAKGVYDELLNHGVRPENILVSDSQGVLYEGRRDIQPNPSKVAMSEGVRRGMTVEDFARGADFVINLGSVKTFTRDPVWTRELIRSLAADPIVLPLTNPEPGLTPPHLREIRSDAYYGSGNQEYVNPFNNFVAFGPTALGALTAQAMWMGATLRVGAARGIYAVSQLGPPEDIRRSLPSEQREFGRHWLVPRPDDPRLIQYESGAVARAAAREGLSGILGPSPSSELLARFDRELDRRLRFISGDLQRRLEKVREEGPDYLRSRHPDRYAPVTITRGEARETLYQIAPRIEAGSVRYFASRLGLSESDWAPFREGERLRPAALSEALHVLMPGAETAGAEGLSANEEIRLIAQLAAVSPGLGFALAVKRAQMIPGAETSFSVFDDPRVLSTVLEIVPEAETSLREFLSRSPWNSVQSVLKGTYAWRLPSIDVSSLNETNFDGPGLISLLSQDPLSRSLLALRVGELEPIHLERHLKIVMGLDEHFFRDQPIPERVQRSTLRLLLLSHDLGKPAAMLVSDRRGQHEYNPSFLRALFAHWGVDAGQTRIALALLNSRFGSGVRIFRRIAQMNAAYLAGDAERISGFENRIRNEYGLEASVAERVLAEFRQAPHHSTTLEDLARTKIHGDLERGVQESGLAPLDFFRLAMRFHQVDAGAWTTTGNGGRVQIPGAETSAFDDLFVFDEAGRTIRYNSYVQSQIDAIERHLQTS